MKIHYSELDSFLACPAAYKRRYIDGVKDLEESSALHCGTALHLAIKTFFEGGDAETIFLMYWNSYKDVDMIYYRHNWEDLRNLGVRWLQLFIKMHGKKFTDFKMEQLIEAPLFFDDVYGNGEIIIEGTFDMCSKYDGVLTMTDWKTSSSPYKENKIIKNPQLYLYSHMYRNTYGILPEQIQYKTFCKGTGGIQTLQKQLTEENLAGQLDNVRSIIKLMLAAKAHNLYPHTLDCYCKEFK
jgi:PD-(D/E)XK nuclease superfamily